eukprot:1189326-Prorocentrum_minimum.AAC.1
MPSRSVDFSFWDRSVASPKGVFWGSQRRGSPEEAAEIGFADPPDWVEVRAAAVVLGQVTPQPLVHIGAAQHQ